MTENGAAVLGGGLKGPHQPSLETDGLRVRRGTATVLDGVSLRVGAGEAVALVGPNGAGKSTLLLALAGLLPAASGAVRLDGRSLGDWDRDTLARTISLVRAEDQGGDLLAVEERVALGRYPHRGPFRPFTDGDHAVIEDALARTGIAHLRRRRLGTLSAGERQRAALARGLAQEPRILLLDEPTAHLDVGHQLALFRLLDGICRSGVTVLAVIHELPAAAAWAGRMLIVDRGRVTADGPPRDILVGEACAAAFGVQVRAHAVSGLEEPLYSFRS